MSLGAFLDGAIEGLNFYVKPELDKLLSMDTVKMVIQQIFFSLGVGQGPVITLASYNRFHGEVARDCVRVPDVSSDSIAVAIVNGLTSFYAGFVTFMIAGFLAHTVHKPVGDFLKSGNELAFVVYPAATGLMPGSQFWGIFFMLMLTIVGFNTQMATVDSMTCCLLDQWPQLLSVRIFIAGLVCAVGFLAGIPFCLKGGMLWFFVVDHYTTLYIMILILLEVIVAIYIYGLGAMFSLLFSTNNTQVVIIYAHATTSRPSYGWYQFPDYIVGVGWCLYVVLCLPLLFFMVYNTIRIYWSGKSMWALIEPTEDWGPPVDVLEKEMTLSQGKPHDRFLLKLEQLEAEVRTVRSLLFLKSFWIFLPLPRNWVFYPTVFSSDSDISVFHYQDCFILLRFIQ
ncbi:unnamed protein product [Cyprideis torosa]|uniref:Sodium-dependent nutrient amino acid transporter 1 n=1 Tax=Cyprideis torosa TaxID=163714 RepID=A0A7R8W3V9_9CRUS|nr:unnamed protein product [Cyprideis torosa]CAG0883327.1 unnamed protein product [Cyprideis torosa]